MLSKRLMPSSPQEAARLHCDEVSAESCPGCTGGTDAERDAFFQTFPKCFSEVSYSLPMIATFNVQHAYLTPSRSSALDREPRLACIGATKAVKTLKCQGTGP